MLLTSTNFTCMNRSMAHPSHAKEIAGTNPSSSLLFEFEQSVDAHCVRLDRLPRLAVKNLAQSADELEHGLFGLVHACVARSGHVRILGGPSQRARQGKPPTAGDGDHRFPVRSMGRT